MREQITRRSNARRRKMNKRGLTRYRRQAERLALKKEKEVPTIKYNGWDD